MICSAASYLCIALLSQQSAPAAKQAPPRPDFPAFQQQSSQYSSLGKNVWLETSARGRRVLVSGTICRREVSLEEFMCLKNTKEHESIVTVDLSPKVFHAAILAAGAKPGSVARFDDDGFHPPTGDKLEVTLEWKQNDTVQRAKAQDMIRDVKTGKAITHEFVFAGSQELKHPLTGEQYYLGEEGDLISVANFAGSIVDLAIKSSATDTEHSFETLPDRIPPEGTAVVVILKPVPSNEGKPAAAERPSRPAGR